jgi:hypothetical protein
MRIMELPGWPPQPSNGYKSGDVSPSPIEEVTIEAVRRVIRKSVGFSGRFQSRTIGYTFVAPDEKTADKIAAILSDYVGDKLSSIMSIEIPSDELWTR